MSRHASVNLSKYMPASCLWSGCAWMHQATPTARKPSTRAVSSTMRTLVAAWPVCPPSCCFASMQQGPAIKKDVASSKGQRRIHQRPLISLFLLCFLARRKTLQLQAPAGCKRGGSGLFEKATGQEAGTPKVCCRMRVGCRLVHTHTAYASRPLSHPKAHLAASNPP